MPKKDILVTGAHRSGTTWVGHVIKEAPGVHYIHEPFNVGIEREYTPLKHWFEYVFEKTDKKRQKEVRDYLRSFFDNETGVQKNRWTTNLLNNLLHRKQNRLLKRNLFKDPLAVLSVEWFYKTFNSQVVVLIRHPAAFVASLKVAKWGFGFKDLLDQEDLIENQLNEYEGQIREYCRVKHDIIDQGILLWNVIYSILDKYRSKYGKKWYYVRHEDISLEPLKEFRKMFSYLDLEFTENVRNFIVQSSTANKQSNFKRNSKQNIHTWKERLSPFEIERIKEGAAPLWGNYYQKSDW